MTDPLKNFSPTSANQGLGDLLQDQLKLKSEAARQSASKNQGADEAQMSMSASTRQLYNFIGGGSALDALIS